MQERYRNQTLSEYVFGVLQKEEDIPNAITQVLEIIGRQFGVSRVYILRIQRMAGSAPTHLMV